MEVTGSIFNFCGHHKAYSGLTFNEYLESVFGKVNKGISIIFKLQPVLSMPVLLTNHKSFVRLHLDHEDVIYDQPYNES